MCPSKPTDTHTHTDNAKAITPDTSETWGVKMTIEGPSAGHIDAHIKMADIISFTLGTWLHTDMDIMGFKVWTTLFRYWDAAFVITSANPCHDAA